MLYESQIPGPTRAAAIAVPSRPMTKTITTIAIAVLLTLAACGETVPPGPDASPFVPPDDLALCTDYAVARCLLGLACQTSETPPHRGVIASCMMEHRRRCEEGGPANLEPPPTDLAACVAEVQAELELSDRCDVARYPSCGYESE